MGRRDEDASELARRPPRRARPGSHRSGPGADQGRGGRRSLRDLANGLLDAIDPDMIEAETAVRFGAAANDEQRAVIEKEAKEKACDPFDNALLRRTLADIKQRSEIVIDDVTTDVVLYAGFDVERAREMTGHFEQFIEENKDRLAALRILLNRPYRARHLTYAAIAELAEELTRAALAAGRGAGLAGVPAFGCSPRTRRAREGADRHDRPGALRHGQPRRSPGALLPAGRAALQSLDRAADQGRAQLLNEQMEWLGLIKGHIAANAEVTTDDLKEIPISPRAVDC